MTERVCAICLEVGSNCTLSCCGAEYHMSCISRWVEKQNSDSLANASCPLCRRDISGSCDSIWDLKCKQAWFGIIWAMDGYIEETYGRPREFARQTNTRRTNRGNRSGCSCSFYFSLALAVYFSMLRLLSSMIGLCSAFPWSSLVVAGIYTIFCSFLIDFYITALA